MWQFFRRSPFFTPMYKLKTNRKKHSNVKSWWPFWSQISIFTMNDNSSSTAPIVLHHNNQESHFYGWDFPNKAQLIRKREKTIKTYLKERKWKKSMKVFCTLCTMEEKSGWNRQKWGDETQEESFLQVSSRSWKKPLGSFGEMECGFMTFHLF